MQFRQRVAFKISGMQHQRVSLYQVRSINFESGALEGARIREFMERVNHAQLYGGMNVELPEKYEEFSLEPTESKL